MFVLEMNAHTNALFLLNRHSPFWDFIKEIEPKIILVYGAMPNEVFNRFKNCGVQFFQYDNWIKRQHEKSEVRNGKR